MNVNTMADPTNGREVTPEVESKDFFEEMRYDITIEYNRLRLQERKLIVAQYLHEHLGAHQIDAWRACEYLDFAGQKQRLLRRLRQQGLTQNEERTLVALMDKI